MSINGREIFNANALMAYKTYFSHELSYSTTAKDSHLNAMGYYRDTGDTLEMGEVKPARYAVRKTMMKSMFISQGRYEFTANLFMDQIPRRVTMGLVANVDYVGTIRRSPFQLSTI
ncbi:hypothetical protein niasHT_008841 [Heterodera trifolii]|uniref:Uncharacterized protein n=1 Tax=Heterodera trifolii TaxID=157864 RepID=A0ABD2M137_9BILA